MDTITQVPAVDAATVKPAKAAKKPAKKAEKKPAKSIASKPDKTAIAKAVSGATGTKLKKVSLFRLPGYSVFDGDESAAVPGLAEVCKGAYSLATFIVAGMVAVSPKGTITAKEGHSNIVAVMAPALHKKCRSGGGHKHPVLYKPAPNIGHGGEQFQLNAAGVVFFHNRNIDSGPAFNTEGKHAITMAAQLRKGGELMIPGIMTKPVKLIPAVTMVKA